MSDTLRGRTAVVTGASRGIGLAVARALAMEGALVAMVARGARELEARAAELAGQGIAIAGDVAGGDPAAAERVVAAVLGALGDAPDVLVNNAGLFELARIEDTAPEAFARALDVNLVAPFRFIRAFVGEMRARGRGHVVSIGSIADHTTFPENGAYAASKWGLRALHEVLRAELRGSGVRTTLVSPGPTDTPLWDAAGVAGREGFTPREAMLPADAVADAVRWAVTRPAVVDIEEIRLGRA